MKELHLPEEMSSDGGLDSDEDQPFTHKHRPLTSGLDRTGVTMVVHKITWPHEVVYYTLGKPAVYQELSVPTFMQGYLIVMSGQDIKTRDIMAHHLQDLMLDSDPYGWEKVRAFLRVMLN